MVKNMLVNIKVGNLMVNGIKEGNGEMIYENGKNLYVLLLREGHMEFNFIIKENKKEKLSL